MSRHRIEDLGRLFERLDVLVDHEAFQYQHEWVWTEAMNDEDRREDFWRILRTVYDEILELRAIACGDDALNETTV